MQSACKISLWPMSAIDPCVPLPKVDTTRQSPGPPLFHLPFLNKWQQIGKMMTN